MTKPDEMTAARTRLKAAEGPFWWKLRQLGITARRDENGQRYWQTWALAAHVARRWPRLSRTLRKWCARRGHEWSVTEWGWDGGRSLDVWCRWCNTPATIPMREMPTTGQKAFDLRDAIITHLEAPDA